MDKFICIHGHFYQPPRENPWLEEIELQDSAYPYHDWNERITAECYAPNAAARILDAEFKIVDLINNYSYMSFNFGPTLLSALERKNPEVYRLIIEADKKSMERFSGHGSAMAMAYNHMIMPLANKRDRYTQAIWGIRDFERRFGRKPEGMWLPETAVDTECLEILSEMGIRFTVLSPHQAKRIKTDKDAPWKDTAGNGLDTGMAYLCDLPSGRSISLFFYDGGISHDVGFGGLLDNGENFANRLLSALGGPGIVAIATDGETYGHHHPHGDMALSFCINCLESGRDARLTNFGEYLEKHPPTQFAEPFDNSSWSCLHGVERWKNGCGCNTGMHAGWSQSWRAPLREAMDWLRDSLVPLYEKECSRYLSDPWGARDDYIDVILDRSDDNVEKFIGVHATRDLTAAEKTTVLKLLEMQRNAMLMYTSCGWFFDEVSGIETVQVMRYAARAMQLAQEAANVSLEGDYLKALEKAESNVFGNGRKVYEMFAVPSRLDLSRVGVHYAVASLIMGHKNESSVFCYRVSSSSYEESVASEELKTAFGKATVLSGITREGVELEFAALRSGTHDIRCGIGPPMEPQRREEIKKELFSAVERDAAEEAAGALEKHFGPRIYTLQHIFMDEQKNIADKMLLPAYRNMDSAFADIYEKNRDIVDFLKEMGIRLPRPLSTASEYVLNYRIEKLFVEKQDIKELEENVKNVERLNIGIYPDTALKLSSWISGSMDGAGKNPGDIARVELVRDCLRLLSPWRANLNLWRAQNIYFFLSRSGEKNLPGGRWLEVFKDLGNYLQVKVSG